MNLALGFAVVLAAAAALLMTSGPVPVLGGPLPPRGGVARAVTPRTAGLWLAVGVWAVVGGTRGVVLGAVAAVAATVALGRVRGSALRARTREIRRVLPDCLDLLAACLRAGATPSAAIRAVASVTPPPADAALRAVARGYELGADSEVAWSGAGSDIAAVVAPALARSGDSGAALADQLSAIAGDLRARSATAALVRIRSLGVRLTAPLALTFLPAFVLLGVVPVVAALVSSVLQ